uniref:Uncharacterized protein n=1 Tax=Ralstonia solanacearum TaxID=305 RepID=A0A0S4X3M5_RALSL|nr:protein of unknown function [Ralstonia solanacearum]
MSCVILRARCSIRASTKNSCDASGGVMAFFLEPHFISVQGKRLQLDAAGRCRQRPSDRRSLDPPSVISAYASPSKLLRLALLAATAEVRDESRMSGVLWSFLRGGLKYAPPERSSVVYG